VAKPKREAKATKESVDFLFGFTGNHEMHLRTETDRTMREKLLLPFILCCLLLASSLPVHASHIIGGMMSYECTGSDTYEFTLKVYRDCNCTDCADFDNPAYIAVYNCNDCSNQSQASPFDRLDVFIESIQQVETPDYPCLEEPDVCVQEATYRFSLTLPNSDFSYHVAYQRCCRNQTVSNLILPGDQGSTFATEITPLAQDFCNDSPVFNEFPPTVICANEPLEFDHSATDPDGDQLVYSLCASLDGGGNILSNTQYESCIGARPNPACPPPYPPINFLPPFTPTNPMGGPDPITIDPNTGLITGTPTLQGQYVVGVCVEEFRGGQLLSRTIRDFQFNVEVCDPTVVAQIGAAEQLPNQEYVVISCGENTINFINESVQEDNIDVYDWSFMTGNGEITSNEWEPAITFPDTGQYSGTLILNPGTICSDTAQIRAVIYPEIVADFEFEYDTCVAGPTSFTDLSVSGSGIITNWSWNFGDGNSSSAINPIHTYNEAGAFPVALTVTDTNECQDTYTQVIPYYPVPNLIIISPSTFLGCQPAEIFFNNLSTPINDEYDITWQFGDGGTGSAISPTYTYEEAGTYTVSIDIVSPLGCQTDTTFEDLIQILPAPTAGFSFSPQQPSNLEPSVSLTDESADAIRWFYDFGDGRTSNIANPNHTFRDTGRYEVKQIVSHPSGCQDTLVRIIDVIPEFRYFLPNAFTPNEDGTNDLYRGGGVFYGIRNFEMLIVNRWGETVFEANDPMQGWNGRKNNVGQAVPEGVYMVLVTFTGPRGDEYEYRGVATVVR
jgi:gliding motility-associated-like protein